MIERNRCQIGAAPAAVGAIREITAATCGGRADIACPLAYSAIVDKEFDSCADFGRPFEFGCCGAGQLWWRKSIHAIINAAVAVAGDHILGPAITG